MLFKLAEVQSDDTLAAVRVQASLHSFSMLISGEE